MLFFALQGSDVLGKRIAEKGGFDLARHEERFFDGGEHKTRPLLSVRGEDVYVLLSLHGTSDASANDKLCKLLFFIAACKDNGASRVTALVPYMAYSRKDRQTKSRDPVTTRYVAQLFEAVDTDMVATLDVHTIIAFQNAFRCPSLHLDTHRLFADVDCPARRQGTGGDCLSRRRRGETGAVAKTDAVFGAGSGNRFRDHGKNAAVAAW